MNLTRYDFEGDIFHLRDTDGRFVLASDAEKEIDRLTRERDETLAKWEKQGALLIESIDEGIAAQGRFNKELSEKQNALTASLATVAQLQEDWKRMYELACFRNSAAWAEVRGLAARHVNQALTPATKG